MFNLIQNNFKPQIWNPNTINLGDFLNGMPVVSGIAKALGEPLRFVVPPNFRQFRGFKELLEYQPCIKELVFQDDVINFDHSSYIITTYNHEEFKHLTVRPNRPIETMRWEKTVRDHYPTLNWQVDDNFEMLVPYCGDAEFDEEFETNTIIVGDRWNKIIDTRRAWNILEDSGLFKYPKFYFLDYNDSLVYNAHLIKNSKKPFVGTFTGSGMLADLLKKTNICFYDDSMLPTWNGMPIEYSYHKHYYGDRKNYLMHLNADNVQKVINGTFNS